MYPYTETETPLSILSPCVSVREYRGSARRARELKKILAEKETEADINLSPAVSRSVTGSYVSNIGETPKKRQFLRRGVEKDYPELF